MEGSSLLPSYRRSKLLDIMALLLDLVGQGPNLFDVAVDVGHPAESPELAT
jgi:hypothetical protein